MTWSYGRIGMLDPSIVKAVLARVTFDRVSCFLFVRLSVVDWNMVVLNRFYLVHLLRDSDEFW